MYELVNGKPMVGSKGEGFIYDDHVNTYTTRNNIKHWTQHWICPTTAIAVQTLINIATRAPSVKICRHINNNRTTDYIDTD